ANVETDKKQCRAETEKKHRPGARPFCDGFGADLDLVIDEERFEVRARERWQHSLEFDRRAWTATLQKRSLDFVCGRCWFCFGRRITDRRAEPARYGVAAAVECRHIAPAYLIL